ncbi:MAG: PGF-pre-PGF domain-containing protein [Methanolobus sp.]|nr:PGF-pre-PGF domain-containing protein [Methanolobus sp.]
MNVGETSDISIYIGNCSNVTAVNVSLSFDNTIVEFAGASVHNDGFGSLNSTNSSGTVDIEVTGIDRFNATSAEQPVIDVSFKALGSGSTVVSLDSVELTTDFGSDFLFDSSLSDGSINVNTEPVSNNAPTLAPIGNKILPENDTLVIALSGTDLDGDDLTFATNATFGSFDGQNFNWTSGYGDSGVYYIEFNVTDGLAVDNETITITVVDVTQAPVFANISPQTIEITKNLQFIINATDADGDKLTYSNVSALPENATFNASTRLFDWTPVNGQEGTYSVEFQVTDGKGAFDNLTVPITVKASSIDSSSSSGSSGGGGGGATGEAYENIEFKDYTIKPVLKDVGTVFSFGREDNNIISVSFTTGINGGQTKAVVEMLKGTSTLVSKAPSGTVYKNMNIWVGDGKFLPELISDAMVVFKVEKSWIESSGVDPDSIKLLRYSGSEWKQLPTSRTGEGDAYLYYVAETPGFSPFAISSVTEEIANVEVSADDQEFASNGEDIKNSVDDNLAPESNIATQNENSTGTALVIFIMLGVVFIGLFGYNKREYCEGCYENVRLRFGNPDGKRYRRFKR